MVSKSKIPRTRRSRPFRPDLSQKSTELQPLRLGPTSQLEVPIPPRESEDVVPGYASSSPDSSSYECEDLLERGHHPLPIPPSSPLPGDATNTEDYLDGPEQTRQGINVIQNGRDGPEMGAGDFDVNEYSKGLSESCQGEDEVDMASSRVYKKHMYEPHYSRPVYTTGDDNGGQMCPSLPNSKHRTKHAVVDETKRGSALKETQERNHNSLHKKGHKRNNHSPSRRSGAYDVAKTKLAVQKPLFSEQDSVDQTPADLTLTFCDLLGNLVGIFSYLIDVGTDIWVAYTHFTNGNWWWFGLTLGFVAGPSLVMTLCSLIWYIQESREYAQEYAKCNGNPQRQPAYQISRVRWVSRFAFLFLQIAPVLRYTDSIIFCVRSWKADAKEELHVKRHWYDRMLYEDTDSTLLRLIECFMEAAPQLVLQLYIISANGLLPEWYMATAQVLSCITSLLSLSWALAAYHKALRLSLPEKANMTWPGFTLQFFWRLFIVGARILALALFASSVYHWVLGVAVSIHWLVMMIWCLTQTTSFCGANRCQETFFNMIIAVVYIFTYLNLTEGHTRLRYIFYYSIVYAENLAMVMVWYAIDGTNEGWYQFPAIVAILGGFFIGVTIQIVYYLYFHPNNNPHGPGIPGEAIRCWVSCSELCKNNPSQSPEPVEEIEVKVDKKKSRKNGAPRKEGQLITRGPLHSPRNVSDML